MPTRFLSRGSGVDLEREFLSVAKNRECQKQRKQSRSHRLADRTLV